MCIVLIKYLFNEYLQPYGLPSRQTNRYYIDIEIVALPFLTNLVCHQLYDLQNNGLNEFLWLPILLITLFIFDQIVQTTNHTVKETVLCMIMSKRQ